MIYFSHLFFFKFFSTSRSDNQTKYHGAIVIGINCFSRLCLVLGKYYLCYVWFPKNLRKNKRKENRKKSKRI